MKTKIKNEFQNPYLIFGNENQKRKLKMKNEILITITVAVFLIFIVFGSCLDTNSSIPFIVCALCEVWFMLFLIVNWNMIKKIENKY